MKRSMIFVWLMVALVPLSAQMRGSGPRCCMGRNGQPSTDTAPIASNPVVDITGTISQVHIAAGEGMPYLDVKSGADTTKVYLGSMRYLISEDFNPKAGQEVTIKAYKLKESVVAIQVTLPTEKKTLKLRDEKGWPLWRGGPRCRQQP
jgi:hypothetical protein